MDTFDIIVVGGGHAGCEAALVAACMGKKTLLVTMSQESIARMSCNPAIGGLAKGHLVREIDALGGWMGKIADRTGIQFRMLNKSKGPAVWGPRAQSDKEAYSRMMREVITRQDRLSVVEGIAENILVKQGSVVGLVMKGGAKYFARAIILTTGTFLRGLMHTGDETKIGGRIGEPSAEALSENLRKLGLELGRLKTGTPPRLHRDSIDFSKTQIQYGDEEKFFFSYESTDWPMPQVPCHILYTNLGTHKIIRDNLHRSPLFSGKIKGIGPRYCPSIEDKAVRFAEKDRHQLFLEPQGIDSQEIYVNGASSSLPADVQEQIIHSLDGLQHAKIIKYGYAVEYDFVFTHQTTGSLECKRIKNLFFAGQINGTSGYEEAAAQGLMAGINAVLSLLGKEPFVLRRDEAYIGVLIDDLVTKCPTEPYRMFTSRAEYRLLLRQDNADMRLTPYGYSLGLISKDRFKHLNDKRDRVSNEIQRLKTSHKGSKSLASMLRQPEMHYRDVVDQSTLTTDEKFQVEAEIKYEGYIEKEKVLIERFKRLEGKKIPPSVDYDKIKTLKTEARKKLTHVRPASLGQASRIAGVTPADISILMVWLEREHKSQP